MSKENGDVIKSIYKAFGKGDIQAVLELFDPTIEWIAAENSPLGDRSPYRGHSQVVEGVFTRIGLEFPGLAIQVDELLDAGDKIVMLGRYHGVRKATGKGFQAQVAHIWTLASGKVTKFQQYLDTYQVAQTAN
jgi:ketosteroid isomerase-like protein